MKLRKLIPILMAVMMIAVAILPIVPFTSVAAAPAAKTGVSLVVTSTGELYKHSDGKTVDGGTWSDAVSLAVTATSPVTIVLNQNLTITSTPEFNNCVSEITVDGKAHLLTVNIGSAGNNAFYFKTGANVIFKNIYMNITATGGTAFKLYNNAKLTLKDAHITVKAKWAAINFEDNAADCKYLSLDKAIIITDVSNAASENMSPVIVTGNENSDGNNFANININESCLIGKDGINVSKYTTGDVSINKSVIALTKSGGVAVRLPSTGNTTVTNGRKSTLTVSDSAVHTVTAGHTFTAVNNQGNGTVSGSFVGKIATLFVNGAESGTYTSWVEAITAANAALANGNVELRISGGVVVDFSGTYGNLSFGGNGSASNGGYLGAAGGNKLTISGATGKERIVITRAHHTFYPTGIVEFKDLAIYSNASSIINNNGNNNNAGEELIFNNVDIYVNTKTQSNHVIEYMESYLVGSQAKPDKLIFKNGTTAQLMEGDNGTIGKGFVWCDFRGAHFVDIIVEDSRIDLTAGKAPAFCLEWNTGGESGFADYKKVPLINMTVKNSKIMSKGVEAITNIEQIKSFTMDLDSVIAKTDVASSGTPFGGTSNRVLLAGNKDGINIDVNGTKYTTWASAVAAANAASVDTVITLNSNVVVNGQTYFNQINGKKITVDGQGKYGILTIAVNNVMCLQEGSKGDIEFRDLKVSSHSTGSFVQIYAPVDVTIENVEFLVSPHQKYCLVNSLYTDYGIPSNVVFRNVTARGDEIVNAIDFYRSGNSENHNYINLIVDNCDIQFGSKVSYGAIQISDNTSAKLYVHNSILRGNGSKAPISVSKTANPGNGTVKAPAGFASAANDTVGIVSKASVVASTVYGAPYFENKDSQKVYTNAEIAPETKGGAEVRLITPAGIRFITEIKTSIIDNIGFIADEGSIKYGTVVVPSKFLATGDLYNDLEALIAAGKENLVLDIPATKAGTEETANGLTLRAAVVGLSEDMYALELQAMAYAEYTVNGQTFRIYSPSVAKRSVKNVAINAIIDINDKYVNPEQDGEFGYPYLITDSYCNNTGMYSPYTTAQRRVLAEFAGFEEMDYAIMFEKVKEAYGGKYFSVLGDSISTFNGISNNASINSTIGNNAALYPWGEVQDSSNTYWGRLIGDIGMKLCVDNAWSGSHVVGTEKWGYKDNMYFRATELDRDSGETPDVIFVFMSTNDLIHTSTFGDLYTILKTNNGKTDDEKIAEWFAGVSAAASASGNAVKPFSAWDAGYALSLNAMKNKYQGAELFCLTLMPNHHSGFTAQKLEQYNTCIKALGNYFGATVVELDQGEIIYDNCSIFTVDGAGDAIHPNHRGFAYMERKIVEAMYKGLQINK